MSEEISLPPMNGPNSTGPVYGEIAVRLGMCTAKYVKDKYDEQTAAQSHQQLGKLLFKTDMYKRQAVYHLQKCRRTAPIQSAIDHFQGNPESFGRQRPNHTDWDWVILGTALPCFFTLAPCLIVVWACAVFKQPWAKLNAPDLYAANAWTLTTAVLLLAVKQGMIKSTLDGERRFLLWCGLLMGLLLILSFGSLCFLTLTPRSPDNMQLAICTGALFCCALLISYLIARGHLKWAVANTDPGEV